jgi:hypothetical protein
MCALTPFAPAGSIPDDIGNLTLLSDLHLDHNSLSGKPQSDPAARSTSLLLRTIAFERVAV